MRISPSGNQQSSGTSFRVRFGNGSVAADGALSVTKNVASGFQRILRGQPTPATSKAVELSFRPLLPLILAGAGLLYNQGRETAKGQGGENHAWLRVMAESSLAYAVLANTSGIYPLFGIALAAYRAGQERTGLDQVKALVNTAVTLSLGYAGVRVFKLMSNVDAELDNEMILKSLKAGDKPNGEGQMVKDWVKRLVGHDDENVRNFGKNLEDLGEELTKNVKNIQQAKTEGHSPAVLEAAKEIGERLQHLKAEAAENFGKVKQQALEPLENETKRKMATNLMSHIQYSQSGFVKALRAMNPIFGYMIAGLMVGAPIAGLFNRLIDSRYPTLKQKKMEKSILPTENRIWNGQNSYQKAFKVEDPEINIGPTMINPRTPKAAIFWPGINNNQPIQ